MLKAANPPLLSSDPWEEVRLRLSSDPVFDLITEESERVRIYKAYIKTLKVTTVNYISYHHFVKFISEGSTFQSAAVAHVPSTTHPFS